MKKAIHMITVLGVIGVIVGAVLSYSWQCAQPLILENERKARDAAIFNVLPLCKSYEEIGEASMIYEAKDEQGNLMGYAFQAEGNGYQGKIVIMVGIDKELRSLTGIEILTSTETPGLGGEIVKDYFKEQFKGVEVEPKIIYIKNRKPEKANGIQAITGATISSRSVVNILNDGIGRVRDKVQK